MNRSSCLMVVTALTVLLSGGLLYGASSDGSDGPVRQTKNYRWATENDGKTKLYFEDRVLGVYDPTSKEYRKVEVDGKVSEPVPFPWQKVEGKPKVAEEPLEPKDPTMSYVVGGSVMGGIFFLGLLIRRR
jgi:hypothetical protein